MKHIVVLGAGVVDMSCAYELRWMHKCRIRKNFLRKMRTSNSEPGKRNT